MIEFAEENEEVSSPQSELQKLVIVRHGDYDGDYDGVLTERGKGDIAATGQKLKLVANSGRVVMFSSPRKRAVQSADILGEIFGIPHEEKEFLAWGNDEEDRNAAMELINTHKQKAEIIILVTHLPYAKHFPNHFGNAMFGRSPFYVTEGVDKGQALLIDCVAMGTQIVHG